MSNAHLFQCTLICIPHTTEGVVGTPVTLSDINYTICYGSWLEPIWHVEDIHNGKWTAMLGFTYFVIEDTQ